MACTDPRLSNDTTTVRVAKMTPITANEEMVHPYNFPIHLELFEAFPKSPSSRDRNNRVPLNMLI